MRILKLVITAFVLTAAAIQAAPGPSFTGAEVVIAPCDNVCPVPDLIGMTGEEAIEKWHTTGFTGAIIFDRWGEDMRVVRQTLSPGTWQCCPTAVIGITMRVP